MKKDADHKRKVARMLLWFEAQLPEHDVGGWVFEIEPKRIPLVDDRPKRRVHTSPGVAGLLVGHGTCSRCGMQFDLERCGNFGVWDDASQDRLARDCPSETHAGVIATAKEWIVRAAKRAGKCWGDVPQLEEKPRSVIVLDAARPEPNP
jgi:hypothetical protein